MCVLRICECSCNCVVCEWARRMCFDKEEWEARPRARAIRATVWKPVPWRWRRSGIDVIPDLKKRQNGKEKSGLVKLCLLISS